jgi:hypothetical protein
MVLNSEAEERLKGEFAEEGVSVLKAETKGKRLRGDGGRSREVSWGVGGRLWRAR